MYWYNREGTSKCVLYREVVLSLEVEMYWYNREGTSKCVLYREVLYINKPIDVMIILSFLPAVCHDCFCACGLCVCHCNTSVRGSRCDGELKII